MLWTGSAALVWGGRPYSSTPTNQGWRYLPGTDSWSSFSAVSAPTARERHTAIWTGSKMIVWGGSDEIVAPVAGGGIYNP